MEPSAEQSTVAADPVAALRSELAALRADHQTKLDSLSIENAGLKERIQALEVTKEKEKEKKKKKKNEKEGKETEGEEEQGEGSTFQNWRSHLRSQMTMVFPYLLLLILLAVCLICRMIMMIFHSAINVGRSHGGRR
jgi:hypothetical protein